MCRKGKGIRDNASCGAQCVPKKKEEKIERGPKPRSYAKRKVREDMVAITVDCRNP